MRILKHIAPTLSALMILAPLQVEADEFSCQSVLIDSNLPSAEKIPKLMFCGPKETVRSSESTLLESTRDSFLADMVEESPAVQSYRSQLKASEYSLKSAKGSWWPSVSMSNSSVLFTDILSSQNYGGSPSTPSSPSTSGTAFNPFNGSSLRDGLRDRSRNELTGFTESYTNYIQAYPVIQIQWNFIDPTRYPQIAAAKNQLNISKSQLLQATQKTRTEILLTYSEFLFSGFEIAELSRLVDLQKQIVDQARNRVTLKLLPRFQAEQEFRRLLSYQSQLKTMQIKQVNENIKLQSLLQPLVSSNNKEKKFTTSFLDPLSLYDLLGLGLKDWPLSHEETVKQSIAHSEALKQLTYQSAVAKDNANEQWGGILPTIGFLGYSTYQYTAGSQNYAPPTQPKGAASSTLSNYAGLSFSWNIFDGHATRNQAKSYEQKSESYKAQYDAAASQLRAQTLESLNQLDGSDQLISLSLSDLLSAEQIALDTKARSAVGLAEQYDVLNSQMEIHQSRLQLIQSLSSYIKTYAQLIGLVGSIEMNSL